MPPLTDHARNCRGREYECTCGFDDQQAALLKALAGLFADWDKRANIGPPFPAWWNNLLVRATELGLYERGDSAKPPLGPKFELTDLGRQAVATANS